MRVYRVEADCDYGMYPPDGPYQSGAIDCATSNKHPHPKDDGIDIWNLGDEYVFGFTSICSARDWFGEFAERLELESFLVSVYLVPKRYVVEGGRQCVFLWKESIRVKTYSPMMFLKRTRKGD